MTRLTIAGMLFVAAFAGPGSASDWDEYLAPEAAYDQTVHTLPPTAVPLPSRPHGVVATRPQWTFRADALAVWRSQPQSLTLFQEWDQPTREYGEPALDADQFQSPMAAGPRFTLLWEPEEGRGFEASFLRVQSFTATQTRPFASTGYAIAEDTTIYGNTWTALDAVDARLGSSLQSFEFLARRPTFRDWLTFTGGFRWVQWNEDLDIVSPYRFGAPPVSLVDAYATDVANDLYGLQLGLDTTRSAFGGRATLQGVAKAGVYGNDARQSSRYVTDDSEFPFDGSVSTDTLRTAFVGEVGMTLGWQLTPGLAARIGYSAFWLGGLATAPAQLAGQQLIDGEPVEGSTSTGGSVVVQGLTLGLEGRW